MSLLKDFLKAPRSKASSSTAAESPAADDGLGASEDRLTRLEAALVETEARLRAQSASLASRMSQARVHWETAKGQGVPGDSALESRLASVIPDANIAKELSRAREARMAAIQKRQDCVKVANALLGGLEKSFGALEAQLEQDSRLLEQVLSAAWKAAPAGPPPAPADEDTLDATLLRNLAQQPPQVPPAKAPPALPAEESPASRRAAPRVALVAEVDIASDTNFFNGFSTDIADGGLFVATCSLLPLGSTVDVRFSLPNGTRIESKGEVRWVRELDEKNPETFPGMGVRFLELSEGARQAIGGFVAQREPMFFPD